MPYFVISLVLVSAVTFGIRAVRFSWSENQGWLGICGLLLIIILVINEVNQQLAALIGASLWLILIFLPMLGLTLVNHWFYQQRYDRASQLASILCWLHPGDGWREQSELLRALNQCQQGKIAEAKAIIDKYQGIQSYFARHVQALWYWMNADWGHFLVWIDKNVPESLLWQDYRLLLYYLRALGETGQLNRLLEGIARCQGSFESIGDQNKLNLLKLYAFAFCGQPEQVLILFSDALAFYPHQVHQYWLGTAYLAAGNITLGQQKLQQLEQKRDRILTQAVTWRLSQPQIRPEQVLNQQSWQILLNLDNQLEQDAKYSRFVGFKASKAPITYSLIGINLLFFAVELWRGGSENIETLEQMGALVPARVLEGQWWRLLTANFLHYGWLHLGTNMLALQFLGPFVEINLGKIRYLLIYALSGIGAMVTICAIALQQHNTDQILLGASAAIMGLIGAITAIFWHGWRKEKSQMAAHRLKVMIAIVTLQFCFDFITPQVSFLSHLLGLIIGLIISNLLLKS